MSGWWQREADAMGLPALAHDARYQQSAEFLTVLKGLWIQRHFSFSGQFYEIDDITLAPLPVPVVSGVRGGGDQDQTSDRW